jgi:ribonuclease-3
VRDLANLEAELKYQFREPALLRMALLHPSIAHEASGVALETNQRLEFLGDAVLQLSLSDVLYRKFPRHAEGALTKARAGLVNRSTLVKLARQLDLGRYLQVSRGEESSGGRDRPSALADAFEAVLGAVYLDGGFAAAQQLVGELFKAELGEMEDVPVLINPKGELQEWLQAKYPDAPEYHIVRISGPDHDRVFECKVTHNGKELARGMGKSKKTAESEAAQRALAALQNPAAEEAPAPTPTSSEL